MGLVDLKSLGDQARSEYLSNYSFSEYAPSDQFLSLFKEKYEQQNAGAEFLLGKYSAAIKTSTNNTIDFPYSLFLRVSYFLDFAKAYREYSIIIDDVIHSNLRDLVKNAGTPELEVRTSLYKDLKKTCPDLNSSVNDIVSLWKSALADKVYVYDYFLSPLYEKVKDREGSEIKNIFRFLSDNAWSHTGKSPIRTDGIGSSIMSLMSVVQAKQGVIPDLVDILIQDSSLLSLAESDAQSFTPDAPATGSHVEKLGRNRIYYGAPGSGKSYQVDQLVQTQKHIRTVFHPEYQNSDFVGSLKPSRDDNGITYRYIPGPFIEALLLAHKNHEAHCYLVIEEINRANAAAVFGEIFQLLDRNEDGSSVYSIDADELLKEYLESKSYPFVGKIRLPANLSIVATMNSSDQGVFILDSAFKRRWEFSYCTIDFSSHGSKPSFNEARIPYGGKVYNWSDFAVAINQVLQEQEIEEDRLVGPYFLSDEERKDPDSSKNSIGGKLFIYLWDDVLKHGMRSLVFDDIYKTFASVINDYNEGLPVFNSQLDSVLASSIEPPVVLAVEEDSSEYTAEESSES